MQVNNILATGIQGYQNATQRAGEAAQSIASQSVKDSTTQAIDQKDLTTSLVDLKSAEIDARANAKVIESASDLIGSLLDVTA